MRFLGIIFGLFLLGSIVGIQESFAEESILKYSDFVIHGGTLTKIDEDPIENSTILQVEMAKEGYVIVPKIYYISANPDCTPNIRSFFILVDGYEQNKNIDENDQLRIDLSEKNKKIEFVMAIIPVQHTTSSVYAVFCKMLDDGIHMNPHVQRNIGFSPSDVICKDGLNLIFKPNNHPACVKPSTAERLVERGWIKSSLNIIESNTESKTWIGIKKHTSLDKIKEIFSNQDIDIFNEKMFALPGTVFQLPDIVYFFLIDNSKVQKIDVSNVFMILEIPVEQENWIFKPFIKGENNEECHDCYGDTICNLKGIMSKDDETMVDSWERTLLQEYANVDYSECPLM